MRKYWCCDVLSPRPELVGLSLKLRIAEANVAYAFFKTETESVSILKCSWVGVEEDTVSEMC